MFTALLITAVLGIFYSAARSMRPLSLPVPTGHVSHLHVIDTTDDVPIYVTPVNNHKEHTMTSTVWPLTTTDTTTCVHRPWSGWNVELDGEYPIGFVAVCEACETNIIKHESGWVDHGSTPSAANLDMLHAEKRHDWYDPENADGFWSEG